jgi:2-amino-4-hydroxy-6-hydroxymethyldihydropteridine diphosphokinase
VKEISAIIETKPYGPVVQGDFLNCVVLITTKLKPEQLLDRVLDIEKDLGRVRTIKWGPRKIDIDILLYESMVLTKPDLVIPHPELHKREFILRLLTELCPEYIHPVFDKSVKDIWKQYHKDSTILSDRVD